MSYIVTRENFDSLASCWTEASPGLDWGSVFVLPAWLKTWWQELGTGGEPYLKAVRQGERIIGIAPLLVSEGKVCLIGGVDVCDYLDFIVVPGMEEDFFNVLLDDMKQNSINHLDLRPLRPDSIALNNLAALARKRGYEVLCSEEEVSLELDLPATWDEYLMTLNKKQRHEIRRKLRRLWEAGNVNFRWFEVGQQVQEAMDTFLQLFALSRKEKANFMTSRMESFFRSLAEAMAEFGLLKFGIVELDTAPAAMIMGFDYNGSVYLYNSAFDPRYNSLSVGLLCKVLCIQECIQEGKKKFDFLKGDETYKYHIGGREIPLYNCQITIN